MVFYTREQCEEWCAFMGIPLDEQRKPDRKCAEVGGDLQTLRGAVPKNCSQLLWFSQTLEAAVQPRTSCLVWITDHAIFESAENDHLYYRLRNSYGDFRLLHDAPGHFCLKHERPEAVTLLYLSILFGWDAHLLPVAGYARAFVSHDEWFQIAFSDKAQYDATKKFLSDGGVRID